jgi:hypothetical protein
MLKDASKIHLGDADKSSFLGNDKLLLKKRKKLI